MSGVARKRLVEERKSWRKDHPIGFWARPQPSADGSTDMFRWKAGIPGKEGTDWQGGVFTVSMEFSEEYPARPPRCKESQSDSRTTATSVFEFRPIFTAPSFVSFPHAHLFLNVCRQV
jgi:Ubiquitin-conjugating enzyme